MHGVAAGLNVLVTFPLGVTEGHLIQRALAARGPRAPARRVPRGTHPGRDWPGWCCGYGSLTPELPPLGIHRLAVATRELLGPSGPTGRPPHAQARRERAAQ